jgi:hypothetical protein
MKDAVKFKWEGTTEHEAGIASYEIDKKTYSLRLHNFQVANIVYMMLSGSYRTGYEDGVRGAKNTVQSALSKLQK